MRTYSRFHVHVLLAYCVHVFIRVGVSTVYVCLRMPVRINGLSLHYCCKARTHIRAQVVKVVDFGFAEKRSGPPGTLSRGGTPKGSPLWMAPEVLLNLGCNEKSDVYSWALIVWQLLTRAK